MDVQELLQGISLATSMMFLVASFYLIRISKPQARWIYIGFAIAWIANIAFYVAVLFANVSGHDWSALLRVFTNGLFGTWLIIISCEKFCTMEKYKNFKKRINSWNQKSQRQ